MDEILLELLEMASVLECIHALHGEKIRVSLYHVFYVAFSIAVISAVNHSMFSDSAIILSYMGMYLFSLSEFRCGHVEALVNCVLTLIIIGIVQMICYVPAFYLTGEGENSNLMHFIIYIFCIFSIFLINKGIKLHVLSQYFLNKSFLLRTVFAITVIFFGINLYHFKNIHFVDNENYLFLLVFICMVLIMAFQWQKARSEAEQRAAELRMQEMCNSSFAELITQVRMRQHDFRNHLSALRSMQYTSSSLEELREKQDEYCQYIEEENKFNRLLSAEGNRSMVGFLYSKFLEADKKGIVIDYEIRIGDLVSAAGVYSLMEVAGILLDNAVEAVAEKDGEERAIRCSLTETEESIRLQVGNVSRRYRQDEMERFFRRGYSTKGNGRGLGLENVKRIMERSRSEMSVDNKVFNGVNYLVFELVVPKQNTLHM